LGLSSNLIGEWNHPNVSLGIRILILNSIREKIIFDSHWFMKDEKANIGRKDFNTSIRQGSSCVFLGRRSRRMSVREMN
jgi:hypothetical protein